MISYCEEPEANLFQKCFTPVLFGRFWINPVGEEGLVKTELLNIKNPSSYSASFLILELMIEVFICLLEERHNLKVFPSCCQKSHYVSQS